jgi:hypothetical protein
MVFVMLAVALVLAKLVLALALVLAVLLDADDVTAVTMA